jgi:type IV secretory pathway VirB10-like protein
MRIDHKILNELSRYKEINNYIMEQDVPPPPPPAGDVPPVGGATPPPPPGDTGAMLPPPPTAPTTSDVPATPVDTEADPDVEKVEDENSKKVEVTDLVKSQKSVEEKQDEYFENLFNHLNDLESKLSAMDGIIEKLNNIETKIEKYRTKTPEEKLELRTLDSGPFNQKLSQFFEDKEEEMEMTGKNEYVLTPDEVESYSPSDIKRSFRNFGEDEMTPEDDMSKFKKIY